MSDLNKLNKKLSMYVCGPTVYDDSHIGHARTYITVDIIHRVMRYFNKETFLVMNITDIDDKIINKAKEANLDWKMVAKKYEDSFFDSMYKLNVLYPHVIIRVSEVIPEIIKYIQKIIDNGFAYPTKDGSIYFDTGKYKDAGYEYITDNSEELDKEMFPPEVSEISVNMNEKGVRNTKKNARDFSLWKGRKYDEVGFDAMFDYNSNQLKSYGRPGWHIECSTMIHETLGDHFDIHFGGIDLKFPHHYNENAQANAFHHPKFMKNKWCDEFRHTGHLCIDGLKMSKSLKNFTTINDILKITSPNVLRWLFLKYKWNEPMNYSEETLKEAKFLDEQLNQLLKRTQNFPFSRKDIKFLLKEKEWNQYLEKLRTEILFHLESLEFDSFVNLIQESIKRFNVYISLESPNESLVNHFVSDIKIFLEVLGFNYHKNSESQNMKGCMNILVETRCDIRQLTRNKEIGKETKNLLFDILDKQRKNLDEQNIQLQDTKDNSFWWIKE